MSREIKGDLTFQPHRRAVISEACNIVPLSGRGAKNISRNAAQRPNDRASPQRGRVFSIVELISALKQEKAITNAGKIINRLTHSDLVILVELGRPPFGASGGASPFHLLSNFYKYMIVIITTNLSFSKWALVFGAARMTTALRDRLTRHRHILETGNDGRRFKNRIVNHTRKEGEKVLECSVTAILYIKNVSIPGRTHDV